MIEYVQKFSIFTIIYSILVYLIVMIGIITILVSIGYEWREWSKNIKISTEDYEKCINSFRKDTAAIDETEYDTNVNEEEAFKYFSILTMHLNELEKFGKETIDILEKGSNPILNSTWNEYMGIINQLNENVLSFDKIPAYVVEKNIPLIKQLDKIKEEIIKLSEKQKETIKNSTVSSMFFKGCNTKEKLEKRYKSLCKTYHPDVESGDEDVFKQIQEEYEKMKNA